MSDQRVRLAIVDDYNVFATSVFTSRLIHELEKCNYDVLCYLPKYRSHFPLVGIDRSKVKFVWGPLNFPFALFRAIRSDRRQIVVIPLEQRTMGPTVISLLLLPLFLALCSFSGMKTVINLQGLLPLDEFSKSIDLLIPGTKVPKRIMKLGVFTIYYLIFRWADRIQVFAKTFGIWVQQYGGFREKIRLAKFGVERPAPMMESSSRVYPQLMNLDYVLVYGYVVPRKGLELLLDAWVDVRSKRSGVFLAIAGSTEKDPSYVAFLKRRIADLELGDSVLLTGYVPSRAEQELFQGCCCVVLPYSFSDSFSGPLCTALSNGTPIVATKIGFFSDLFEKGGALLCVPKDKQSLAQALLGILNSKDLRQKLKEESESLTSSLEWDRVGAEYCRFFDEALRS